MRGFKGLLPLLFVGAAGVAWLLFVSEPGSRWLTSFLTSPPQTMPIVGHVPSHSGEVKRVHGGDVQKLSGPIDLHDGDRLETNAKSGARVQLNSQDEFELAPLSSVSLQLWSAADPQSAVYLTVLSGDARLVKPGVRGRAFVVREGRLYLPGQRADKKPMALTVTRIEARDIHLPGDVSGDTASTPEPENDAPSPTGEASHPDVAIPGQPDTLSNEYIDATIAQHQPQLQKCWLSRLKNKPQAKGTIALQFEINRRGRVRELKMSDDSLHDAELAKCVTTVIERITFRAFKGAEISLTYPITFE